MSVRKWVLSALLLAPSVGCSSLSDFHYEQTQHARARAAWRAHGRTPSCYAKDYEAGWKDGFYDIATGGKGCPPLVAPCKYWAPEQVLQDHDRARNAYYSGFQDGVACSLRYPQTHYLKLWTSCECPGPECGNRCVTGQCLTGECGPCASSNFEGGIGLAVPGEYIVNEIETISNEAGPIDSGLSTSVERIPTTEIDNEADPGKLNSKPVIPAEPIVTEAQPETLPTGVESSEPVPAEIPPTTPAASGAAEPEPGNEGAQPSVGSGAMKLPVAEDRAEIQLAPPIDLTGTREKSAKLVPAADPAGMIDDADEIATLEPLTSSF